MGEDALLTGTREPTNEPYAIAKIAGIKLCESYNRQYGTDFQSVMPTNLYGPGDNYDLETSHVIPALIRKMHLGKCLERGDWESLRADLNARPIGGIDGTSSEDAILDALASNGISSSGSSLITHRSSLITIEIWGTGKTMREFLHVNDMSAACMHVMNLDKTIYESHTQPMLSHINVGTGKDCTIKELAQTIA
jgi:GDP-L-fucose synthase